MKKITSMHESKSYGKTLGISALIAALSFIGGCVDTAKTQSNIAKDASNTIHPFYPVSDPTNRGGWILNTEVSDEFDAEKLDEDRWYIVGKLDENGKPIYKDPDYPDREVWIGRAPAQFSGQNVRIEDGMLKISARWDPDFPFETKTGLDNVDYKYEKFTTAAIINRKMFRYGYMEVYAKAADAEVSSALWMTRHSYKNGQRNDTSLELDIFEHFGSHRIEGQGHQDRDLWWTIRDWDPKYGASNNNKSTYTETKDIGFRVAADFHTYGFEWAPDGIRYYVDGKLFSEVSSAEVEKIANENGFDSGWVIDKAMHLWLDSESFPWRGYPDSKEDLERNSPEGEKEDGIVDFEVTYLRVWQKPEHLNVLD